MQRFDTCAIPLFPMHPNEQMPLVQGRFGYILTSSKIILFVGYERNRHHDALVLGFEIYSTASSIRVPFLS